MTDTTKPNGDRDRPSDREAAKNPRGPAMGPPEGTASSGSTSPPNIADVELLAPITAPCRVICQSANYRQHMIESGVNPDDKQFNLLFMKSDATLAPPRGDVRVPAQVQLLNYELELGLVFGKPVSRPTTITADTLPDYVAALVMTNDVSARDIQLPQNQWFKGKSYRGFCPVGPVLSVLEPDDYPLLDQLELTLLVNERVRQHDSTQRPRARRRAADRNAVRLRTARAGAVRAKADGPVARTREVACIHQGAEEAWRLPQARRCGALHDQIGRPPYRPRRTTAAHHLDTIN